MTKPTQAQQIAALKSELSETRIQLEILTAGMLTVAERNGTSGWATLATLLEVARETPDTDHHRAMVRAADAIADRVSWDALPGCGASTVTPGRRGDRRLSAVPDITPPQPSAERGLEAGA